MSRQVSVVTNSKGMIELDRNSESVLCENMHWIRAIRISDDCHSYNVQLKLLHPEKHSDLIREPKLVLQSVKPIESGEELLMWFSEDVLAMLQVAFLTPHNIQGKRVMIFKNFLRRFK